MRWLKRGEVQTYDETEADRLKLAQAIAREGRPQAAVAWTLVQRFAFLFPRYESLERFVAAYSQPVNPRWFDDGDLHRRRMKQLEGNAAAQKQELERARRRKKYAAATWDELEPEHRRLALEAIEAAGDSPVPGAVHFRGSKAPRSASGRQAKTLAKRFAEGRADLVAIVPVEGGYGRGVNWFFTAPGSSSIQMLDAEQEELIPKDHRHTFAEPPVGAPTGEGWGWRWSYSAPLSLLADDELTDEQRAQAEKFLAGVEPPGPDDVEDELEGRRKQLRRELEEVDGELEDCDRPELAEGEELEDYEGTDGSVEEAAARTNGAATEAT